MKSIANVELGIPVLPPHLKNSTVFKEINRPLFSIPVVRDGSMEVTFRKNKCSGKIPKQQIGLNRQTGYRNTTMTHPNWRTKIEPHAAVTNNGRFNKEKTCK